VFAQVFARAVEASLHGRDAGLEGFGDFGVAAALLDEREERAVLGTELREGVAERVEFLGIHRPGRLGDVFVLVAERQENAAQLLAAELVDAGVAREPEEPRLELRGRLQAVEGADHFDEDLLRQILHVIAAAGHGVNEAGHPVLVADNKLPLGDFVALLSPADKVGQCGRCSWIHAERIRVSSKTGERPERFAGHGLPLQSLQPSRGLGVRSEIMKKSTFLPVAGGLAVLWCALLLDAGCHGAGAPQRDLMAEEVTKGERPVAMRGGGAFLDGTLTAVVTVSRGFDRGMKGESNEAVGKRRSHGKNDDPAAGLLENLPTSYGSSDADQQAAMEDYIRVAMAQRAAGSPMPPVTLRVQFENHGTEPLEVAVIDVNSELGNFAVRPEKLLIAPGATGALDPMISQLGVTSDELPIKVALRAAGKKETQVITVKTLLPPAAKK